MNPYFMKYSFLSLFFFLSFVFSSLEASPDMKTFLSGYYASPEKAKGYSKLLYAMEKEYDKGIAIKLLNAGENPNAIPEKLKVATPFILAVGREDEEVVSLMIQKGADVNLKSYHPIAYSNLTSPLFVAVCANNQANITQMLCLHGARVIENAEYPWNEPYNSYSNPIGQAIRRGDFQKFKIMADTLNDQKIRQVDAVGKNLIGYSVYNIYKEQKAICEYLIERGLSIETKEGSALSAATMAGNLELMQYFISLGANINFRPMTTSHDPIPIFAAIYYSNNKNILTRFEPLTILLDLGADINFSYSRFKTPYFNDHFYSPLSFAIEIKLNETAQILINYGADVNYIDISKKSPLFRAIEANNLEGVKLLLAAGANLAGPYASKLIELAYSKGYLEIAKVLIEAESAMYD